CGASARMRVTACRMCGSNDLFEFLNLGSMPPADSFLTAEQLPTEQSYPLEVLSCRNCGLAQLSYVAPKEVLFCQDYPYEASSSQTACKHWADFAASVQAKLELPKDSLVVDIGSNVGVLLQAFQQQGQRVVGVDPAKNMARLAKERRIPTFAQFFDRPAVNA